jgi:pyrroloquinoline quinone biosynthesis protein D
MTIVARIDDKPALQPLYRLQFEAVQDAWVLLYPEGMVRLNASAAEILRRCDGTRSVQELVEGLERDYGNADLRGDVCHFLGDAYGRGWVA